ncbi:MAG: YicC/YloC family endoribonuclease [Candidatus Aminicenantaceae bacterium]
MIQSMTGFGEKRFRSKTLSAKIIIKSLNHRYLDWNYYGAPIGGIESRLREICQKGIYRGRVEVNLELNFFNQSRWDILVNMELLDKILTSLEKASSKRSRSLSLSIDNLFRIPQVVDIKRKDFSQEEITFLKKSFKKTLEEVIRQRTKEGREIERAIRRYINNISRAVKRIEKLARKQPFLIRDKLMQRLKELSSEVPILEDKLVEEAAYYAQKYDITEEIERLKIHLHHIQELLLQQGMEPLGRKLDFIAQELFREVNTINSKSQDVGIIKESLSIKGEVENIRQQVQNIE